MKQYLHDSARGSRSSKDSGNSGIKLLINPFETFQGDKAKFQEWKTKVSVQISQTKFSKFLNKPPSTLEGVSEDKVFFNALFAAIIGGAAEYLGTEQKKKLESGHVL